MEPTLLELEDASQASTRSVSGQEALHVDDLLHRALSQYRQKVLGDDMWTGHVDPESVFQVRPGGR